MHPKLIIPGRAQCVNLTVWSNRFGAASFWNVSYERWYQGERTSHVHEKGRFDQALSMATFSDVADVFQVAAGAYADRTF